jgi:hypothetical protein
MSRINLRGIFCFVSFLICFCFAQETHNLEIIWQKASPESVFAFGRCIASGDVNGDSFSDLIVGAYCAYIRPGFNPGRVYIYYGGPNFDTIPDVILDGGHNNDEEGFGYSVSGSGDVNNNGFDDIIIGAVNFGNGRGRIYIYYGGNPMDTIYDVAMTGEGSSQYLGESGVDFLKNNYAYDHVITECQYWPYGFPRIGYGKVYVLFGGTSMDSIPDIWMIGRTDTSCLGTSIASAGDLNMDGCDEIISSAPWEGYLKGCGLCLARRKSFRFYS